MSGLVPRRVLPLPYVPPTIAADQFPVFLRLAGLQEVVQRFFVTLRLVPQSLGVRTPSNSRFLPGIFSRACLWLPAMPDVGHRRLGT